MYVIKSNRKTNSYTVRKINRVTQVVRVGRRGLQGKPGPEGPEGPKGDKGEPGDGLVESVNGKQGVVVLNATDVGADPTGSASQALQDAKDYTDSEVSTLDSSLATVAKTGSYNDLSNKPTIPSIAGLATEAQVQDVQDNLDAHTGDTSNPHNVTKAQVGLGNVDNTSDLNKPVSTAQQTALNGKQDTLVSGTNIKTINSTSILGSGDIVISGGGGSSPELLGKYVHSGNLVAQPTAVDLETGVFTCVSHGLTTGNLVFPRFNTLRNTPLLAVFPGGLTATNLTVTVLTPDTFTVGISPFTSVDTMDLGAWAFERYVTANANFHRVTLAAPVTSCRVVAYGINGTRYIKSDGFPSGTNPWVAGGVITDKFGSVSLGTASEVAFFLEYSARYVGNMVLLNGRKLTIGVGSVTANVIASTNQSNTVSSTPTVPTSFGWFGFDNGRVLNGNTIEVWDR